MDILNQSFYKNDNGNLDEFCALLDCGEQALYFLIKNLNIDYKKFFLEDINLKMVLIMDKDKYKIKLSFNRAFWQGKYFIENEIIRGKLEYDEENVFLRIKNYLDKDN